MTDEHKSIDELFREEEAAALKTDGLRRAVEEYVSALEDEGPSPYVSRTQFLYRRHASTYGPRWEAALAIYWGLHR